MAERARATRPGTAAPRGLGDRDIGGMLYTGEMYGLQVDLLATALAARLPQTCAAVGRWRRLGYAESARLGPGPAWVWLTRAGLAAGGLRYAAARAALSPLGPIPGPT